MFALQEVLNPPQAEWWPVIALFLIWTTVWFGICTFLRNRLAELPVDSRTLSPWIAYSLLIPCVNVFANFVVLIGISQAYIKSFAALGRELPVRESGRVEAVTYSMLGCVGMVPMESGLQGIVWMVAIGAIIIYLFKIHSLAQRFARIKINA